MDDQLDYISPEQRKEINYMKDLILDLINDKLIGLEKRRLAIALIESFISVSIQLKVSKNIFKEFLIDVIHKYELACEEK